jgi:uncharacterized membrane protein
VICRRWFADVRSAAAWYRDESIKPEQLFNRLLGAIAIAFGALSGILGVVMFSFGLMGFIVGIHGGPITSVILALLGSGPGFLGFILIRSGIQIMKRGTHR